MSASPGRRALESAQSNRAPFGAQRRRILCATDLSTRSERAMRVAAILANRLGAQLMLLHVISTAGLKSEAGGQERVRAQLCTFGPRLGFIPVLAVREDDVAKSIARVAVESGVELIVMGTQRSQPLATIFGTTAEQVVALARRPVLIVRSAGSSRDTRVIAPADVLTSLDCDVLIRPAEVSERTLH